jgi:hypothetical protein
MELTVSDNGPGIPQPIRSRIFDPFFTTKPVGAGTGIGLGVSRGIVEAHGGTLTLANSSVGAWFVVRLPLHAAPQGTAAAAPAPDAGAPRDGKSVLIDSNEPFRSVKRGRWRHRMAFPRCAARPGSRPPPRRAAAGSMSGRGHN